MSPRAALGVLALVLAGCGSDLLPPLARPDADVRLELEARQVDAGQPVQAVVQIQQADGITLDVGSPAADGLEAQLTDERSEPFDGWSLTTRRYELTGEEGSYVVQLPTVTVTHPDGQQEALTVAPVFVDIGVKGPSSQLEGLLVPAPPPPPTWPWVLGTGVLIGLGVAGGAWVWRHRRRSLRRVAAEPADLVARRAWKAVLADRKLDDHARALQCSEVFRVYLQAVHPIPASALTSREIEQAIYARGLVPGALLDRARRLLQATDLLKFARRGGGPEFFYALDQDFQAYVEATRPRPVEPREGGHA
ncbi:MAG: hypothetical protein ABIO70_37080 [Pseudomonadota bacterium]